MGLGSATKKLQMVADMGEELYGKMNELREQLFEVRQTVQDTNERVTALENTVDQQAAILEALAEKEGIDVEEILTEVAIEEAEPADADVGAEDDAEPEDTDVGAEDDAEPEEAAPDAESDADTRTDSGSDSDQ